MRRVLEVMKACQLAALPMMMLVLMIVGVMLQTLVDLGVTEEEMRAVVLIWIWWYCRVDVIHVATHASEVEISPGLVGEVGVIEGVGVVGTTGRGSRGSRGTGRGSRGAGRGRGRG